MPLGHRYSTLGEVMNLNNIQRVICFVVGLLCMGLRPEVALAASVIGGYEVETNNTYGTANDGIGSGALIRGSTTSSGTLLFAWLGQTSIDTDIFAIYASAPGLVDLNVSCGDPCSLSVRLTNVSGATLAQGASSYSSRILTTAVAGAGSYYIVISRPSDGTTNYSFTVTYPDTPDAGAAQGATLSIASSASVAASSGSVALTVTRSGSTTGTSTVGYFTTNRTATYGTNYTYTTGTLTFADNETTKTITIPILNSSSQTSDRSFSVTLSGPSSGTTISNATAAVTVVAAPQQSSTVSITSSASVAASSGSVALTVTRSGSTTGTSTVAYFTTNRTATAGVNYTYTSGTLTFAANETSKTITVPILNSSSQTSDRSFSVTISGPSSETTISNATAAVTIVFKLYAVVAPLYVTPPFLSYIRLVNAGEATAEFTIAVVGSGTATDYGTATYAVPAAATLQLSLSQILVAANAVTRNEADAQFSFYIQSPAPLAGYQHITLNQDAGFFGNASICKYMLQEVQKNAVNQVMLPSIHTSRLAAAGYPSQIELHNSAFAPVTYRFYIRDEATGALLNPGGMDFPTRANASYTIPWSQIESQIGFNPSGSQLRANLIVTDTTGAPLQVQLSQSIVNTALSVLIDMTSTCAVNIPPLRQ